jgi:hypothetical protein
MSTETQSSYAVCVIFIFTSLTTDKYKFVNPAIFDLEPQTTRCSAATSDTPTPFPIGCRVKVNPDSIYKSHETSDEQELQETW